ncbi:hypothetical protein GUJ93_ZPchr0003g16853 [Zizania palustris]|uniref:Peptidase A1 domain-containing protein n=1 Tax=Zizania palustris TaxID=103762 RepID=A0A8J5S3J3_ZIZPA|nr:hypothetical protein GUJ93_ZPchr0003g16853 [Zizania palustris]
MKQPIKMQKLALLVVVLLAALAISRCTAAATVRMQLTHADAARGLGGSVLLQRMALRSKARSARFPSSSKSAPVSTLVSTSEVVPQAEYVVHMAVGTPPQPVRLLLDTGSDLIWTQCLPCPDCFNQILPYFNSSRSSTFAHLPCDSTSCHDLPFTSCSNVKFLRNQTCVYTYDYGDKSMTTGLVDKDTFTFGASGRSSVPGVAFGCGEFNSVTFASDQTSTAPATGIAGFGRGPLSLPSQLRVGNFSHCFTALTGSKPSTVMLDLPAHLYRKGRDAVHTTPLVQNPVYPSFYYLSLKGITVGSTMLPVPESSEFALRNDGTGGTVIDSGTSITTFPPRVYRLLRDAFAEQMKLPMVPSNMTGGLTCFSAPRRSKPHVPKLVLHFEDAKMDLPRNNYVYEFEDEGDNFICLAITEGDEMSTIGNYQQQNMHVLYDLQHNKLSFVSAHCDKL